MKKPIQSSAQKSEIEKLMEYIDLPYSGGIEADFKPLFVKTDGTHFDCFLHYYDPENRNDLSVLVALAPFDWRKVRCSRSEDGHYFAHFLLPKECAEPFQVGFM